MYHLTVHIFKRFKLKLIQLAIVISTRVNFVVL